VPIDIAGTLTSKPSTNSLPKMRNSYFLRNQTRSVVRTWLIACSVALTAWSPLAQAAASEATVETVLVGQAYGPDLVLLQSEEPAKGAAPKPPPNLTLAALHAAGAARLPPTAAVRWLAALPPVRPQRIAGQEAPGFARCAYDLPAGVPAASSQPAPMPHDELVDWFDPGAPGHCETDDGLAHYGGLVGLSAGMPVLAYTGLGDLKADYAQAGRTRSMTAAEKSKVRAYAQQWRQQFKKTYGKPFRADDNPTGPIRSLADAKILLVLRGAQGRVVLRASKWDRISVGQHLYSVLVVDLLEGKRVKKTWTFSRALGVMG
jgi:hypothetical protein